MYKENRSKNVIMVIIIFVLLLIVVYDFITAKLQHNRQIIIAKMMTEQASQSDDVLYDSMRVLTNDKLLPDTTYRLTVDFTVVDSPFGKVLTLPKKQVANQANLGCVPFSYSEKFVATKEHAQIYLQIAVGMSDLVDNNGNTINFNKQKLAPVVTITKED